MSYITINFLGVINGEKIYISYLHKLKKKKKKMLNTLWLWLNDIRVIKAKGKKKKI